MGTGIIVSVEEGTENGVEEFPYWNWMVLPSGSALAHPPTFDNDPSYSLCVFYNYNMSLIDEKVWVR